MYVACAVHVHIMALLVMICYVTDVLFMFLFTYLI